MPSALPAGPPLMSPWAQPILPQGDTVLSGTVAALDQARGRSVCCRRPAQPREPLLAPLALLRPERLGPRGGLLGSPLTLPSPAPTLPFGAGPSAQSSHRDALRFQFPRPPAGSSLISFPLFIYPGAPGAVRRPRGLRSDQIGRRPGPSLCVDANALSRLWKGRHHGGLRPLRAAAVVSAGAGASVQGQARRTLAPAPARRKRLGGGEALGAGRPVGGPLVTQRPQGQEPSDCSPPPPHPQSFPSSLLYWP